MKHVWSILIVVTLIAVLVGYLLTQPSAVVASAQPTEVGLADVRNAENDARLADMEVRLEKLQARLDQTEEAQSGSASINSVDRGNARQAISPSTAKDDASERNAMAALRPAQNGKAGEGIAQDQAYQRQTAAALEVQLAGEEFDPDWAVNFQVELTQGLKSDSFAGTNHTDVECKSSLCRVTLAHDNTESEERFFEHMLELPILSNTEAYFQREINNDGSTSLVLYVAREGQTLPLPRHEDML